MDLRSGILSTAQALGVDPLDLATIISYETAGTFDPAKRGPTTQWGQHRGLIQFGEPQAQQHGVDWNDPLRSQLGPNGAVASYFRASGAKPGMGLLDLYSIVNAGGPGLYDRTDENNGGAPGTVRDKVENQMSGHRRNAERLFGGETLSTNSPAIATAGLALTPSLIPGMDQEAPQMEPETAGGLLGMLFPDIGADRADQIRLGINGMLHNPNTGMQRSIESRMGERAQGRERQQAAAQAQQQANKTIAAMRQGGAPDYLIAAAEAGQVMPAFQEFLKLRATQMQGQEPSAAEAKISRLMETGLSREEAINAADRYVVSRDPMTGDAVLVDRATGQQVGKPQEQAAPQQTDMPSNLPSVTIGAGDRTDAFGVEGVLKRGANAVADTVGADMPFDDVQNTISDFGILKESLIADIAAAYPRQPPSWLLRNIEELTPKAGTLQGAGTAVSKLEAIRRNFQNEIAIAQRRAAQPQRPAQQQEVEQQIIGLTAALERVDAAISGFDRPKGRTTSSGITFEVIE